MGLKVKYTCRHCGREAIVGHHRCRAERLAKRKRRTRYRDSDADLRYDYEGEEKSATRYPWNKYVFGSGIAALTVTAFTVVFVGPIGLLFLLLVPATIAIQWIVSSGWLARRNEYREFLRQCHGDEALVERLIAAEMRANGFLSRHDAIRASKQRLETDRGA